jgi:hypothetical protein
MPNSGSADLPQGIAELKCHLGSAGKSHLPQRCNLHLRGLFGCVFLYGFLMPFHSFII